MKRIATLLLLLGFCWASGSAEAQAVRNGQDAIWARDVDGASITFDGALDEAVWDQAERLTIRTNSEEFYTPGGGWQLYRDDVEPADPAWAWVYFLRDGNTLWIGIDAPDVSIGGTRDFFQMDGVVMSIADHENRAMAYEGGSWGDPNGNWFPANNTDEFFYSWMNRDMVEDTVGIGPQFFGNEVVDGVPNLDKWDARAVVDGVSNDDFNGNAEPTPDVGYTMEIMFNLENFGYDMTSAEGDRFPMTIGIYDWDYIWPLDAGGDNFRSRAWWQNPWGGDMPFGSAFVYGRPDVTVGAAAPDITEPDLRIPTTADAFTVDGVLDESAWGDVEPQVTLEYLATPDELDELPGIGPYYTGWFRPGGGPEAPPVLDPSVGEFRMIHQGDKLYLSLDAADAAVSGQSDENRADGFRFVMRNLYPADSVYTEGSQLPAYQFFVVIDSTGAARPLQDAFDNPAVTVAASLDGASTAGNPNDVDTGYQIEMEIDLAGLGYDLAAADRQIWWGVNYFDGDDLPIAENSYGMRTWFLAERDSGPMIRTYLDPNFGVANEESAGALPLSVELIGNYPNPFAASTTLRYALPEAGEVEVRVFDLLGREVAVVEAGQQAAGTNDVTFEGRGLASGVYLYRVDFKQGGSVQARATGRMVLMK